MKDDDLPKQGQSTAPLAPQPSAGDGGAHRFKPGSFRPKQDKLPDPTETK